MPSPTSMTVPTSLTWTFCSKFEISFFRTLVISATLMAIGFSMRRTFGPAATQLLFRDGSEKLLFDCLQLVLYACVDQLVTDAKHQAAHDRFVDVHVHDRIALQRGGDLLLRRLDLLGRQLVGDDQVDFDLAELLIEQVRICRRDLRELAETVVLVHHVDGVEQQSRNLAAEDAVEHLPPLV